MKVPAIGVLVLFVGLKTLVILLLGPGTARDAQPAILGLALVAQRYICIVELALRFFDCIGDVSRWFYRAHGSHALLTVSGCF